MSDDQVQHRDPTTGLPLEQEDPPDGHVWRNPQTGRRFMVSPLSGACIPVGGAKGRPGHRKGGPKPQTFKEFSNELLADPGTHAKLAQIAHGADPQEALRAINTAAKYTQEMPKQTSEHTERVQILIAGTPLGFERIPEGEYDVIEEREAQGSLPPAEDGPEAPADQPGDRSGDGSPTGPRPGAAFVDDD